MKRLIRVLLLLSLFSLPSARADLRERLSEVDFEKAGLSKLTEAELDHLSSLVTALSGDVQPSQEPGIEVAAPRGEDAFGLEGVTERVAEIFQLNTPDLIESRIEGEFRGWEGKTVFRLENGQVWRQNEGGDFYARLKNPKVSIRRAALDSYLLSVEGYNSSVRVRRVK